MPELPEVEFIRRKLERWMRGARIVRATALDARIVRPSTARVFSRELASTKIERVQRRGKWIRIRTARGPRLFIHLGMTGGFEPTARDAEPPRFERVRFELARNRQKSWLSYIDPRRWGRIVLAREDIEPWTALGPDPLSDGVDPDALLRRLAGSKTRSIKEALLDQSVLAGVGNIQAIEALWKAGLDPRSPASALNARDVLALVRSLHWTIERTLADLGKGDQGGDNAFRVYGRKGEPCRRCGTTLDRVELGGRTTTFCPGCQIQRAVVGLGSTLLTPREAPQ